MNEVYLLTGGNMGDRLAQLQQAAVMLESVAGRILQKSSIYETAAWGLTHQNAFLNQVLRIESPDAPEVLLQKILSIEQEMGRKRIEKMGPRVIDIDILFFGKQVIDTPDLVVPHPRMADRRFVLIPLHEIAPTLLHPVLHKTVAALLQECSDTLAVRPFHDA